MPLYTTEKWLQREKEGRLPHQRRNLFHRQYSIKIRLANLPNFANLVIIQQSAASGLYYRLFIESKVEMKLVAKRLSRHH